jgi:hypothetical protein
MKDLSSNALRILTYLTQHSDAQDSLEGIAEWWLLERRIEQQIDRVKAALDELLAGGLVLARKERSGRTVYRLNSRKRKIIGSLLQAGLPGRRVCARTGRVSAVKP